MIAVRTTMKSRVVALFDDAREHTSLEVAEALGISKGLASAMLANLASCNVLERVEKRLRSGVRGRHCYVYRMRQR